LVIVADADERNHGAQETRKGKKKHLEKAVRGFNQVLFATNHYGEGFWKWFSEKCGIKKKVDVRTAQARS